MNNDAAKIMLIKDFLATHSDDFDSYELYVLKRNISRLENNFIYYPFVAREIFDKLGLLSDDENLFFRFAKLINELHDIKDKRVIEVGGGVYPTLAERISTSAGMVTVYDPRLTKHQEDTPKLKLVRQKFNKKVDLSNTDLVVGLMPCKAAEDILDACVEQDKDFIVGLCEGGPHGDEYDYFEDEDEWRHSLITYNDERLKRTGKGKILSKELDGCSYPYPVIYNSRK